ncbi:MAG: ribose 5-phosphate isomerase B [Dinghuibacter sp.]|nr:ribose 5-phosphate isomerase B [Dinghuibacter sp.]
MVFDKTKNIALGADHAGFEYKTAVAKWLTEQGFPLTDFGTYDNHSVDYPDFAHPVAESVARGETAFGILFCGSANGVAITANKHKEIRAAICWQNDIAQLARQHNDANIICIPARFVSLTQAKDMVKLFMNTAFEGGRHQNRVNKISGNQ